MDTPEKIARAWMAYDPLAAGIDPDGLQGATIDTVAVNTGATSVPNPQQGEPNWKFYAARMSLFLGFLKVQKLAIVDDAILKQLKQGT